MALRGDIGQMAANLSGLDAAVAERLALAEERAAAMRRVLNTARTARRVSEPGQALIELKLAEWRRAADEPAAAAPIGAAELTATLGSMLPQQRAELVVANLAEATLRIAAADEPAQLAVLGMPVKRSLQQLAEHIAGFPPKLQARAQEQFATFADGLLGPRGLIAVRGLELAAARARAGDPGSERGDLGPSDRGRGRAGRRRQKRDDRCDGRCRLGPAGQLAGPDRGRAAQPPELGPDRLALRPARPAAAAHGAQRQHAGGRRRQSARALAAAG